MNDDLKQPESIEDRLSVDEIWANLRRLSNRDTEENIVRAVEVRPGAFYEMKADGSLGVYEGPPYFVAGVKKYRVRERSD